MITIIHPDRAKSSLLPLLTQLLLLLLLTMRHDSMVTAASDDLFVFFDEYNHTCNRNCTEQPQPMQCNYTMRLEWYGTMSKACYKCPNNMSDCYRPHCITGDGVERAMLSINRQLSSPGLHVCVHDTLRIEVHNHMEMGEAVTLHWHGQHMRNTQHMDGVAMVSQCPIPALSSFVYTFKADPSGTHYYHAHSGLQRSEGLFGPLVVREPNDPQRELYDYDLPQHTLLISDWMHVLGATKFVMHHYSNGDNKPKGIVINGRGAFAEFPNNGNSTNNNATYTPRYELKVRQGGRYRIRVISNAILNCPFQVSVAKHRLLMIASDGRGFVPQTVDSFVIYAGERFDFVLNASQPIDNYLLNVVGLADCDERFTSARQSAIISYEGADSSKLQGTNNPSYEEMHMTNGTELNPFNREGDSNHIPITELSSLPADRDSSVDRVDAKFYLAFDFETINNSKYHHPAYYPINAVQKSDGHVYTPQINNLAMSMPHAPVLYQTSEVTQLCNNTNFDKWYEDNFYECNHALSVKLNQVVELILIDKGFKFDASHPFHLHGQNFRVIGMEKVGKNVSVSQVKQLDAEGKLRRNLTAPLLKDTVIVPDGGYTVIRFHATNPGPWLLHCHLEFHVEIGMGLIILVGDPKTWTEHVPKDFPRCSSWPPKKSAAGRTTDPLADLTQQMQQQERNYITIIAFGSAGIAICSVIATLIIVKIIATCRKKSAINE